MQTSKPVSFASPLNHSPESSMSNITNFNFNGADDEEAEGSEEEFTADRNGAILRSSAYADHAAVATALREYLGKRAA